ncbi:DNA polymerase III subunit delta' [bacterium]|nr:DNA polymerase III subunit delta' [bacterium]
MEIIGHKKQWEFLKRSFQEKRLAHAYLFTGPESVGKKKMALEFAKLVLCESGKSQPCNRCQSCYQVDNLIHPDFLLIEPSSNAAKIISIEEIRTLKEKMSITSGGNYKVAVIDNAHRLTHEAQSALLKLLEEPQGKKIIILVSEFPDVILPTIRSRTQPIHFHFVKEKEIELMLKNTSLTKREKELLMLVGKGRPGVILQYLENKNLLKENEKFVEDLLELKKSPLFKRFNYAKRLKDSKEKERTLFVWLAFLRKKLLEKCSNSNSSWDTQHLIKLIKLLENIIHLFSTTNINQRLALEIFFLEL